MDASNVFLRDSNIEEPMPSKEEYSSTHLLILGRGSQSPCRFIGLIQEAKGLVLGDCRSSFGKRNYRGCSFCKDLSWRLATSLLWTGQFKSLPNKSNSYSWWHKHAQQSEAGATSNTAFCIYEGSGSRLKGGGESFGLKNSLVPCQCNGIVGISPVELLASARGMNCLSPVPVSQLLAYPESENGL